MDINQIIIKVCTNHIVSLD